MIKPKKFGIIVHILSDCGAFTMNSGFIKVAAVSPRVSVGGVQENTKHALEEIQTAKREHTQILVFPELYLSGYTCGDLFLQKTLLQACERALEQICQATKDSDLVVCIGLPVRVQARLYNCAAVVQNGAILAVIPKTYLPNYGEYYEKRWFASGEEALTDVVTLAGQHVPFGQNLIALSDAVILGVEICEDLWVPAPPSTFSALAGANVLVNLSASNESVTKNEYRRDLIRMQSAKTFSAYVYASAGVGESTTDLVYSGACTITENGTVLAEGERFAFSGSHVTACVDIDRLLSERLRDGSFQDNAQTSPDYPILKSSVPLAPLPAEAVTREFEAYPFVPSNENEKHARCREILSIQSHGLAKRLSHTGLQKTVIGISGGLDSTLALLVTVRAMQILKLPPENILAVTMPGFGTTDRTYQNAVALVHACKATLLEIPIRDAALQHMHDIGHDAQVHDVTYENTQARERTQILMDLANKNGAILVGTGDLSELALGWCTYNADHMSMYNVNGGVPKTLVRHLVENEASVLPEATAKILYDVLATPVSPELLPPDESGRICQKTEETLGPYAVHDFYLYHFLRFGTPPEKLLFLAKRAFDGQYSEEDLKRWLRLFLQRFFSNQFKRSCLPDGPKVGSVSLSPRGDWRMPSDANVAEWLRF